MSDTPQPQQPADGGSDAPTRSKPDWKDIATKMAQKVYFALNHLKVAGSGVMMTVDKDGNYQNARHWKEDFADTLELLPGLKVDREAMHALDLPAKQRRKFFNDRNAKAASTQNEQSAGTDASGKTL